MTSLTVFAEPCQRHETCRDARGCNVLETCANDRPRARAFYADAAKHVMNPLPYAVGKYRSGAYAAQVQRFLDSGSFDVVVADFLVPVANMPRSVSIPSVLFTHNVEAEIWRRHAENATNPFARALMTQQLNRCFDRGGEALSRFGC